MGAKQSKRSVDISGKEAEGGGEVAAAGAGGEGRVEQLADADALKPQLNGDAHIHEQTDKEKELDSGTPENEKDATTEKEEKEAKEAEDDKEKDAAPVTNGETEKVENGESTPEDGKKPKKEKVKKKWSLRSISFSRKDKPKQEKKPKEEEPKTNGEPEKVPEETAEGTTETAVNEVVEEAKTPTEVKDEKTPETPVTEPITNGSSTPESPKAETPIVEEPVATPIPEIDRPEPTPEVEPEQLPVNGLTLEEPKKETPEVEKVEETKPEEPATETTEIVPAEIPVKKEVCVEQMPLLEPTPPPLPANPPPSSVASFAATTMAPELTDASLANTAETVISAPTSIPDTKVVSNEILPEPQSTLTDSESAATELPPPIKEIEETQVDVVANKPKAIEESTTESAVKVEIPSPVTIDLTKNINVVNSMQEEKVEETVAVVDTVADDVVAMPETDVDVPNDIDDAPLPPPPSEEDNVVGEMPEPIMEEKPELIVEKMPEPIVEKMSEPIVEEKPEPIVEEKPELTVEENPEPIVDAMPEPIVEEKPEPTVEEMPEPTVEEMPEPTVEEMPEPIVEEKPESVVEEKPEPVIDEKPEAVIEKPKVVVEQKPEPVIEDGPKPVMEQKSEPVVEQKPEPAVEEKPEPAAGDIEDVTPETKDIVILPNNHVLEKEETNGIDTASLDDEDETQQPSSENKLKQSAEPAPRATPQDAMPVCDKMADLISEVPDIPELKTETLQESASDVAVAN